MARDIRRECLCGRQGDRDGMYVLRGDTLERIPEVASHRRRDELSLSVTPRVPGESAGL